MNNTRLVTLAALLGCTALTAHAGTFTTDTSIGEINAGSLNQGNYNLSTGYHDGTNNNHLTGQIALTDPTTGAFQGDVGFDSFETFSLDGLSAVLPGNVITGATLTLVPYNYPNPVIEAGASDNSNPLLLDFYGVSTDAATLNATGYNPAVASSLTSGTPYLDLPVAYPLAPTGPVSISLNQAALAALTAHPTGYFSLVGGIANVTGTGNEYLFGGSNGTAFGIPQVLTITTAAAPAAAAVPEGTSLGLLAVGLLPAVLIVRRRRAAG